MSKKLKPMMAFFLAFLTLLGAAPVNFVAQDSAPSGDDPTTTTVYFMGKEAVLELGADGLFHVDADVLDVDAGALNGQTDFSLPQFVYVDGERLPINSDRILNITPVVSAVG